MGQNMRSGINEILFDWLLNHQDGKLVQSEFNNQYIPTGAFLAATNTFLSASTDASRLVAAEKCAWFPLMRNDLSEMAKVRNEVRTLELSRRIEYPKQTDHSAHSMYVYLLGLYLISTSSTLKNHNSQLYCSSNTFTFDSFLFPWVYNSLLHDIGYAFSGPPFVVPSSCNTLERLFHEEMLRILLEPTNTQLKPDYDIFISFLISELHNSNYPFPEYVSQSHAQQTIDSLGKLPWGLEIGIPNDAFEAFAKYGNLPSKLIQHLESFAYSVADSGYDGKSSGSIDHAITSALFLLQWSTYYYWLAERTKAKRGTPWLENYFMRYPQDRSKEPWQFSYNPSNLTMEIIPSLCSVAFHNVLPGIPVASSILPFDFNVQPLVYISVLADELQKWDRFPAGSEWLENLDSFAELSPTSEEFSLAQSSSGPIISLPKHIQARDKIINTLDLRLKDWRQFITIQ
jgi:hypothetical protein